MRLLKPSFIVLAISLIYLTNASAYVSTLDGPSTEHGTQMFCKVRAKQTIDKLNELTKNNFDEIEKSKKRLNALASKKILIDTFLKIRDDYKQALTDISKQDELNEKLMSQDIDQFKKLMNSSLALVLVHKIAKPEALDNDQKHKTISDLCLEHNQTNFCALAHSGKNIELLDKTLNNLYEALDKNSESDKNYLKSELETIYTDTTLSTISPEQILSDLKDLSPDLSEALSESNREDLINCLESKEGNESCKRILYKGNHVGISDIKKLIKNDMVNAKQKISSQINNFIGKKLDNFTENLSVPESISDKKIKMIQEKVQLAVSKLTENKDKLNSELGFDNSLLNEFDKACTNLDNSNFNSMKKCKKTSEDLISFFEEKNKTNNEDIKKELDHLNKLANNNGRLVTIEKMKKYTIEKYMRKCPQTTDDALSSNIGDQCIKCLTKNAIDPNLGDINQITQLNSNIDNLIPYLKSSTEKLSTNKGELGLFSKAELSTYQANCQNTSLINDETINSVCNDISTEQNKIAGQKESKEWAAFQKKYIVEYAPGKKGYTVTERKSTSSMIGQAVLQSVPSWVNGYIYNAQITNQINMMTNQALYMEQFNYMNNPTSPWMINNPYFQQNYFNTSGVFSGLGTTSSTSGFSF